MQKQILQVSLIIIVWHHLKYVNVKKRKGYVNIVFFPFLNIGKTCSGFLILGKILNVIKKGVIKAVTQLFLECNPSRKVT